MKNVHCNNVATANPFQPQKITCDVCKKEYSSKSSFKSHFRQHMQSEKAFYCNRCGESFWKKFTYEEHMNSHRQVCERNQQEYTNY